MSTQAALAEKLRARQTLVKRQNTGHTQMPQQVSPQVIQRLLAHHPQTGTPARGQGADPQAAPLQAQDVLTMQRMWGNQAVQRIVAAQPPTLTVDGDPAAEQRAQRAAGDVLRGDGRAGSISPLRQNTIKRQAAGVDGGAIGSRGGVVDGTTAQMIEGARGRGRPLDRGVRSEMEQKLGASLQSVRVHTDPQADQLSRSLDATAFTTQRDIFFRRNQYNPQSLAGKQLLAHELTHVVQQGGGVQRQAAKPGMIQRARGKSRIPGAGTARNEVFGTREDRRRIPSDLTPTFLQEIDVQPLQIQTTEKRFLRKDKVRTLDGHFYKHKTVAYNHTTILVLSGSGGSSELYTRQMAEKYCRTGAHVVAVNYRGYGGSTKSTPTEEGLYNDAMSIYQAVINGEGGMPHAVDPSEIVVHGYSLGGPVAATLVKRIVKKGGNVKGLVLDRAMTSTYEAARDSVNPLLAFGAKLGVGSMSTKSKLKSIYKYAPNTPIVFSSAGTDTNQVTDTSMDADVEESTKLSEMLNTIRSGDTKKTDTFVNKLRANRLVKDGLAAKDRKLAQWATNKGMNVSEVRRDDLSHFSQNAMMDSLIPELGNRGLLNDTGQGAYQNQSNLKRPSVQNVIDEVKSIQKLMDLPDRFNGLAQQLGVDAQDNDLNQANQDLKGLIELSLPDVEAEIDKLRHGNTNAYVEGLRLAGILHDVLMAMMRQKYIPLAEELLGITIPSTATVEEMIEALRPARMSNDQQQRRVANNMIMNLQFAATHIMD